MGAPPAMTDGRPFRRPSAAPSWSASRAIQTSIGWQVGSCLTMASVLARITSAGSVRSSGSPNGWLTCQGDEQ